MPTNSPVLSMPLPNAGAPGVGDPISRANLNSFFLTVEDLLRIVECTSLTRPSSPFPRQMIYETDTKVIRYRNNANSAWVQYNGVPIVNNATDVTSPVNGQLAWSFTGFGLYVWKSSTSTWTPLTHDQYMTFRLGTNTAVTNANWVSVPFATAGEGSSAGISTSDNITWTLNEPGIWTVMATFGNNAGLSVGGALFRGTIVNPFDAANSEIYSVSFGGLVAGASGVTMSADVRVATGGTRTVRCSAISSAVGNLNNSAPMRPRISFKWSPL